MRRLLTDPDEVWSILACPEAELSCTPDSASELRHILWPVAVRTVVDDCLTGTRRRTDPARAGE
jgi:CRISPR-associated protein Csx10